MQCSEFGGAPALPLSSEQCQARLAIVAVHLDMIDDAEQLLLPVSIKANMFIMMMAATMPATPTIICPLSKHSGHESGARKKCGRYDLLNQLYQAHPVQLAESCLWRSAPCQACGSSWAQSLASHAWWVLLATIPDVWSCWRWEKALEIAKTKAWLPLVSEISSEPKAQMQEPCLEDRIHLKPTHFAYAQHLEAVEARSGVREPNFLPSNSYLSRMCREP